MRWVTNRSRNRRNIMWRESYEGAAASSAGAPSRHRQELGLVRDKDRAAGNWFDHETLGRIAVPARGPGVRLPLRQAGDHHAITDGDNCLREFKVQRNDAAD